MLRRFILFLFLIISLKYGFTQKIFSNFEDFKDAAANAQPGDELILADGNYSAETIKLENKIGTEALPIIIRAENIGGVVLNEEAFFDLRHSSFVTIQGFVINISEKSTTFKIQTCDHIRITQNVLDGSGEAYFKEDDNTERNSSVWIIIQALWDDITGLSHHNQIDHNTFQNKQTLGNMIRIDGTNEEQVSQYDVIEYNHFKNMGPRAENEMEVIRVGWSAMSESDGFCTIQSNLFEECNGDPEIISVKCNKNTLAHNTFRRCQGTLSLRHGNESLVEGNFFLGEEAEGTGGVRIYGSDHRIINNYFEGLTGTKWDAPITLTEGDAEEGNGSLSKHFRIERAIIANNTIVTCDYGIEIGYDNNGSYSKPPRDVVFANNLVSGSKNTLVNYINQPINMTWADNILFATNSAQVSTNVSFKDGEAIFVDPALNFDSEVGMYKSTQLSPTYTTMNNSVGNIDLDIEGQIRNAPFNYGADELESSAILYHALNAKDVGVATGEYLDISKSIVNVPKEGTIQSLTISSNLSWKVTKNVDWLSVAPSQGDGDGELTIDITENTSGEIRNAQLSIESTNADQIINKTITIVQAEKSVPYLTLSEQAISVSSQTETIDLSISSNTTWSISTTDDWISNSPSSGNGNGKVEITILENESIVARHSTLMISDGSSINIELSIEQEGAVSDAIQLPIISVVASTEQTGNEAVNLIDGDLNNRWSGEGDGASITLDMGEEYLLAFIKVGVYKANERQSMFDVLTSSDDSSYQETFMDITTYLTEEPFIIYDFDDLPARYVQIVGHGNSTSAWNSYTEFELWGYTDGTSSNKLQNLNKLKLYPNPSKDILFIDGLEDFTAEVYNLQGTCISKQNYAGSIDISGLKAGKYLVKIIDRKGSLMISTFVKK
ncbi:MAG: chondroitinase-B domain-containing protein [Prolixibacteraceae bacterium]